MYFQNLYGLKGIGEEISPPNKLSKLLLLTLFTRVKSIFIKMSQGLVNGIKNNAQFLVLRMIGKCSPMLRI